MKKTWISIAALATVFTLGLAGASVAEEPVCPYDGERIGLGVGPRDGSGQGGGWRHGLRDGSGSGQRLQARDCPGERLQARDGSGYGEGRAMRGGGNGARRGMGRGQAMGAGRGGMGGGRGMGAGMQGGLGRGAGQRLQLRDGTGCGIDPADCPRQ